MQAGEVYNKLTVIEEAGRAKDRRILWLCRCECGNITTVRSTLLTTGKTKSCGCLRDGNPKHSMSDTPEHHVWRKMWRDARTQVILAMKSTKAEHLPKVGGALKNFFSDMGKRPSDKHTIERVNNNLPYSPENCIWATRHTQTRNTTQNVNLTYLGVTACRTDWARMLGVGVAVLGYRIKKGQSMDEIMKSLDKEYPSSAEDVADRIEKFIKDQS